MANKDVLRERISLADSRSICIGDKSFSGQWFCSDPLLPSQLSGSHDVDGQAQ